MSPIFTNLYNYSTFCFTIVDLLFGFVILIPYVMLRYIYINYLFAI